VKRLYEKYKNKLVRLSDEVIGTIVGYSVSHLILLLEEGVEVSYSFSLDDLAEEEFFIDMEAIGDCDTCLLSWVDENQIKKRSANKG